MQLGECHSQLKPNIWSVQDMQREGRPSPSGNHHVLAWLKLYHEDTPWKLSWLLLFPTVQLPEMIGRIELHQCCTCTLFYSWIRSQIKWAPFPGRWAMRKQGNDSEPTEDTNYTSHSPTGQPSASSPHLYTHLCSGSRQLLVPVTISVQKEMYRNK